MAFFSLITTAFSCVFYGVIVTATVMAILYIVLKTISKGIILTPVFLVTGVVLAILLTTQFSLMIGAIQAKGHIDDLELSIGNLIPQEENSSSLSVSDFEKLRKDFIDQYPVTTIFLNNLDFSTFSQSPEDGSIDFITGVVDGIRNTLNSYIIRRILWTAGFIFVGFIVIIIVDSNSSSRKERRRSSIKNKRGGQLNHARKRR